MCRAPPDAHSLEKLFHPGIPGKAASVRYKKRKTIPTLKLTTHNLILFSMFSHPALWERHKIQSSSLDVALDRCDKVLIQIIDLQYADKSCRDERRSTAHVNI